MEDIEIHADAKGNPRIPYTLFFAGKIRRYHNDWGIRTKEYEIRIAPISNDDLIISFKAQQWNESQQQKLIQCFEFYRKAVLDIRVKITPATKRFVWVYVTLTYPPHTWSND